MADHIADPNRRNAPEPETSPRITTADHERMAAMNLRVMSYQTVAEGGYWLPRDIIGADGKTAILWRAAGEGPVAYAVDGWHPWHDGMFGGCCAHLASALAWVQRARDVRAGKASSFRGT